MTNNIIFTDCQDVRLQMGHTVKNSVCKPRETHVYLKPKPGYEFRPPMISAMRCRGHCAPGLTPMPTKTTQSEFAIKMHPEGNPRAGLKCVLVKVEEHTKCRYEWINSQNHSENLVFSEREEFLEFLTCRRITVAINQHYVTFFSFSFVVQFNQIHWIFLWKCLESIKLIQNLHGLIPFWIRREFLTIHIRY